MNLRLIIYLLSIVICTFAMSGVDLSIIIKKNHIWEARFLIIVIIFGLSYILANFLYDILTITSIV